MNCQDFENGLDALARGRLADARTREEASAHAGVCARCAALLADERALTDGLRELARKSEALEAPARVESALLAALRAQAASGAVAAGASVAQVRSANVESANVVTPLAGQADARRFSWVKTVAVAALAAAAVLAFFMLIPPEMSVKPKKAGEVAVTPSRSDANVAAADNHATGDTSGTADENALTAAATTADLDGPRSKSPRVNAGSRQAVRAISTPAVYNVGASRGSLNGRGSAEGAGGEEITTDFIPLMQGARFAQGDGGRLVRVELPRSALVSFGLPVNAEAAGGRVKADVLLGEDGLARAIRFVR